MSSWSGFLKKRDLADLNALQQRQYRLIFIISYELIILCSIIQCMYAISRVWYMVILIGVGFIITLFNLTYLYYTKNTKLCGHIATSVTLVGIALANYMVGGTATPYSIWFYVIPLLAVSLIGGQSLFYYSSLSLLMIILFGSLHVQPMYVLTVPEKHVIEWANHLIAFLIIVTTLYSLMRETSMFERILSDQNYLLKADKEKFQHLSRYDQLTNLPNRQYFYHYLDEKIATLEPTSSITVFFMDLDQLKEVNDLYGHLVGDHLLRHTAKRLQLCFRDEDFIARIGGDEFTSVVIHAKDDAIPKEIASRISHEFNKPVRIENIECSNTISIGLATYPTEAATVSDLMSKADSAMYASKKNKLVGLNTKLHSQSG